MFQIEQNTKTIGVATGRQRTLARTHARTLTHAKA